MLAQAPKLRSDIDPPRGGVSLGAAREMSPHWSQETMTCHSSNCFSIVWGQGNAPLVTSLAQLLHAQYSQHCHDHVRDCLRQGYGLCLRTVI